MKLLSYINKLTALAAFLFLLFLSACIAEDIVIDDPNGNNNPTEFSGETTDVYFAFRLNMADGVPYTRDDASNSTKGQDFEYGNENEDKINNLLIVFYDDEGKYLTHFDSLEPTKIYPKEEEDNDNKENAGESGNSSTDPSVESIWRQDITIKLSIYNEKLLPIQNEGKEVSFVAIANYDDKMFKNNNGNLSGSLAKNNKEIIDLEKLTELELDRYQTGDDTSDDFFIMTTAGYYDSGGNYMFYNQDYPNQIFYTSPLEAYYNPSTIYLERLAARIDFEFVNDIKDIEVLYEEDGHTNVYALSFNPDGWGMEAQEKKVYLSKSGGNSQKYPDDGRVINNDPYPADFYDWINYTDGHRTFWAESCQFNQKLIYPAKGDDTEGNFTLDYPVFNNLKNSLTNSDKTVNTQSGNVAVSKGSQYLYEHTFRFPEMDGIQGEGGAHNPYAVPTSIVLRGKYTIKYAGTDEKPAVDDPHTVVDDNQGAESQVISSGETAAKEVGEELSLNYAGFYIRYIDMERTDKTTVGSNANLTHKSPYKYRLYREDNGSSDETKKNDLYVSMLKEQHMVFIRSEEIVRYYNDQGEEVVDKFYKYIPVKANTTYSRIEDVEVEKEIIDNEGNRIKETIHQEVNKTYTLKGSDIFIIANSQTKCLDIEKNLWIDSSNTYTLQLKPDLNYYNLPTLYLGVYPGTQEKAEGEDVNDPADYELISDSNEEKTNKELQKQLGYAQRYYKGYAFFYAPIPHYSGYYNPFKSENSYTGLFNYKKNIDGTYDKYKNTGKYKLDHLTGHFGIVRNHVYNFTVKGISSLGYGIPSENHIPLPEPILEQDIYLFDLEIKILPWNIFEYYLDI